VRKSGPEDRLATFDTIGRYEVLREIGRGAMGVVYEARDPLLDRTVALKVIQPAVAAEERLAFEERFLAEARIAAALQHPGIVVVHDSGRDEATGALFIALELLRGETLADIASDGPAPWPRVMHVVAQVARALGHAHRAGVVHRDIKPANVIVLPTGEAKVTDFGIARLESARQRLTTTGEFIGTPLYTAPEQARVEDVDGRADVFSLASVAYTLLTGRPPFLAPSIPGIVHRVVYEEPEPLSSLVPDLPRDVERVLGRALAKEPDARYPTAEAFAEDAEDLLAGVPPRHAGGDDLVVVEDEDPTRTVKLGAGAGTPRPRRPALLPDVARHPAPPLEELAAVSDTRTALPPPRTHTPRPSRARILGGVAVVLGLVALLLWMPRPASAPAPTPPRATSPGAAPPGASPRAVPAPLAPAPAADGASGVAEPARLRIELDHPLRRGRIRVFVDDTLTLDERITGQERKKALVFKLHEGTFRDELDVAPGLHEVRLEIAWDDNQKVERIVGSFRSGATRTLDASLGRIRRDLSLEWK
jgi:serine/threonine-protein kinase